MNFYRTTKLMLSSAAVLSLATSAFALDGVDLLKKINAAYSEQGSGGAITSDGIDIDGDTVTLKNASFVPTGAAPVPLGNLVLDGVQDEDGGGYSIEKATFADISSTQDGMAFSASDISLGGITVPADPKAAGLDGKLIFETGHIGPVSVKKDGLEVLSLKEITMALTPRHDDSGFDFKSDVDMIKADLSKTNDPSSQAAIDKLGLQQIEGHIETKGSWDLAPGLIKVDDIGFDFKDIGRLDLAFGISGWTLDFDKSLQEALAASRANPDKQAAQQATGLAMLGLMQQLTLTGAEIHFKDASITKKALDYAGSTQGVSGEQMANTLKGLAPIMLAQLNIPELQNALTAAINTYLDDPKSFTVTAAPAKPVPFPMIVGAAMGAPNTIPTVIGLKVSAND